jgi:hypothetical protein
MPDPADLARALRERLLDRRRLAERATPGPWRQNVYPHGGSRIFVDDGRGRDLVADTYGDTDGDATFVFAHQPQDAIAEVERATAVLDLLEAESKSRSKHRAALAAEVLRLMAGGDLV